MTKKDTTYRIPDGFNAFVRADTIRGLTDAVHRFLFEGPGTLHEIPDADRATLNLPRSNAELDAMDAGYFGKNEIREPAAVYSMR